MISKFLKYSKLKRPILIVTLTVLMVIQATTLGIAAPPPKPDVHFVTGQAHYELFNASTLPADGAQVTVTNQRTQEKLYDTVGPAGNSNVSGYYLVDLADFPLGYQDGDQISTDADED